jgi:LysM repeat protein
MVLGLAAVAAVAGCKDPNWNRWSSKNEAKNAGGATEVVAEAGCKCPPGTTHIGPCGCGAADCQCISLPETPKCTCAPGTVHELPCACGAPDCKCVVVKHDVKHVVSTPVTTAVAAPAEPEYTVYIVQRGDYLAKISKKYNITINSIKRLNNMKDDTIRIGQKLKLPGKVEVGEQKVPEGAIKEAPKAAKKAYAPYTGATKEYVVKSGDTLGAIAYGNGINIRQLKELNNLESDVLKVGQKLKIPAEKVVVPVAAVKKDAAPAKKADAPKPEKAVDEALAQVEEVKPVETAAPAPKEVEEPDPSKYGVWVPGLGALITDALDKAGVSDTVKSLVVDGAWGGVATVLGFVPVIFIVFIFLAFLEDCGYMARVAFIMDRLLRRFGLSGKSFIPMLIGKGCGVPAVMAARAIENERARRMTVILATFVPCGAKTVIIAMFAALFFREQWYVAALMDVIGIAIIILGGIALKKTRFFAGEASSFVLELPAYHMPTVSGVWHHTWNRLKGYVLKAGLIIFPACVVLWFVMHFDWSLNLLADEEIEKSILHDLGSWIAWMFEPLGFGSWQGAAASVSAEIAKEQATATLGLVAANMDGATTGSHIQALFASVSDFPKLAALSFMVFNLFVPPCMVAIAVTFREMGSQKWGWFAVGFQLFVGYVLALSVYRIGVLAAGGGFGIWTALAFALDAFCLWAVFRPGKKFKVVR